MVSTKHIDSIDLGFNGMQNDIRSLLNISVAILGPFTLSPIILTHWISYHLEDPNNHSNKMFRNEVYTIR